ncbi:dephospho-CoA kinase [Rubrivirga sp. S365]|uniref:Dephospho-CoA kinase n=1 Tax=Rubrivirga litoralis TaxID=3075598 RepID=A0ABU3BQW3_9BACT|nr:MULTISPECIES: dephospho-CoA kinase [unclassified Rubrivirga]MDT0631679.1 dephospho-CoA kinase [Rubrivirga sp. F394]MDT7855578.1 dephospho-CoA kinase [Rubrivirga sp. S365]
MHSLGVTGGIGSGKSAFVARLAGHDGVRVVYADDLAKRLMGEDAAVRAALVARFGAETYDGAGRLDRAHLAARVFGDAGELAALNAIVHPAVRRALGEALEAARAEGVRLLVYEAALIFETGGDEILDAVVVVDAPVETRVARVQARDGATRDAVLARMRHQIDPAEARRRADLVVVNDGDLDALYAEADALARQYA